MEKSSDQIKEPRLSSIDKTLKNQTEILENSINELVKKLHNLDHYEERKKEEGDPAVKGAESLVDNILESCTKLSKLNMRLEEAIKGLSQVVA